MKKGLFFAALTLLFIIAALFFSEASSGQSQSGAALPNWTADPGIIDLLGPETTHPGFRIRAPLNYAFQQEAFDDLRVSVWSGVKRADRTTPYVAVMIASPPPDMAPPKTLEDALLAFLEMDDPPGNKVITVQERGIVNGITFIRARWTARDRSTGARMHGFSYVAMAGKVMIQISSHDMESYDGTALKLAEAAALTFKSQ